MYGMLIQIKYVSFSAKYVFHADKYVSRPSKNIVPI